jgi:pyruvate dehydrogenase E2 component (dihydrolipoamide acetyltransferase)
MAELEIKMPDLSTTGDSIVLLNWLVAIGDNIKLGQPIAEIETDKATMELEAAVSGKLAKIVVVAGESAKVGSAIAMVESDKSDEEPIKKIEEPGTPAIAQQSPTNVPSAPVEKKSGGMFAKNKAKMSGGSADTITISPTQKVVSQRLVESKQTIPHYYLTSSVNAEGMVNYRQAAKPEKIVWDAFFVSAVAKAVAKYEKFTYRFKGDKFEKSGLDAVGIAVDLDDELFVITIEDASKKDVKQISADIVNKVAKLKAGDLSARKLNPANITITNLGSANVKHFSAIVNPPESAILAIGKIASVPVVKDGQLAIADMVDITLSVDHRIVNGKYAANFLSEVVENIESNWK